MCIEDLKTTGMVARCHVKLSGGTKGHAGRSLTCMARAAYPGAITPYPTTLPGKNPQAIMANLNSPVLCHSFSIHPLVSVQHTVETEVALDMGATTRAGNI